MNGHNRPKQINNTSGFKGVSWDKERKKWRANIKEGVVRRTIGRFVSIADAKDAYLKESRRIAGEFACE